MNLLQVERQSNCDMTAPAPERHIALPFNLRDNPEAFDVNENLEMLWAIYPCYSLSL